MNDPVLACTKLLSVDQDGHTRPSGYSLGLQDKVGEYPLRGQDVSNKKIAQTCVVLCGNDYVGIAKTHWAGETLRSQQEKVIMPSPHLVPFSKTTELN